MDSPIAQIIRELENQLIPVEAEETRAREALARLKDQRQKMEAALAALGCVRNARPSQRGKRCATKQEVIGTIGDVLQANGPLDKPALERLVQERLAAGGQRSLSGFVLRFKEALREPAFCNSAAGMVALADSAQASGDRHCTNGADEDRCK